MEQLNPSLEINKKTKKKISTSTKVLLTRENLVKASYWLVQINTKYQGMIKTNRAEIVNLMLTSLPKDLSIQFLKTLQEQKLDDVTKAKWIYLKLQDAQKNGENLRLDDLMKEANLTNRRSSRRQKIKKIASGDTKTNTKQVEEK